MAITDLTGTTWLLNDVLNLPSGYQEFDIYGSCSSGYTNLSSSDTAHSIRFSYGSFTLFGVVNLPYITYNQLNSGIWEYIGIVSKEISAPYLYITGGDDVTNASLIAWLQENGELQVAKPTITKKFTRLYINDTVAVNGSKCFKRLSTEEPQIAIPAGLYDADDNLVASWDELINTYGMDCEKNYTNSTYKTDTASPYYVLTNTSALSRGTKLIIGDSVSKISQYSFYTCSKLTSVVLGNSVTTIGTYAFYSCSELASITIPANVTSLVGPAFYGCANLKNVYYRGTIADWCNIDFDVYSSNPLNNGANLYIEGKLVSDLVIPDSVTVIKDCAFFGCVSLINLNIGNGVTDIKYQAFFDCTNIASITIPPSVTGIWHEVFGHCDKLADVYYTGSVEEWCNIQFPDNASNPLYYGANLYINGKLVTDLVIPDTVVTIKYRAFDHCGSLTSLVIGDGVTSIENYAFQYCGSLTSVVIGDSVTSIDSFAFHSCSNLASIVIPVSLTTFTLAFYLCPNITDIYYKGTAEQWSQISSEISTSATIHYNYTG